MAEFNPVEFRAKLLAWFRGNRRDLPWRTAHGKGREAYSVVVSEVMLQQTQVTTVLRYYDKWMGIFPTFEALAAAPIEKVLKAWEGLGYYTRARNLKKLAEAVSSNHGGKLPTEIEELIKLPGIGPYSARSIASLAHGTVAACVDGNVVRVLARLKNISKTYKSSAAAQHEFQKIADEVLNEKHPGEHNEAMMEFGATICTKANPQCLLCPVRHMCGAFAAGTVDEIPKFEGKKTESKLVKRVWIINDGKLLLHQSAGKNSTVAAAATGHLDGLWELPTAENLGIKRLPEKEILRRVRNITKYKITEVIYKISKIDNLLEKISKDKNLRWTDEKERQTLPLSGPHAQWIAELMSRKSK